MEEVEGNRLEMEGTKFWRGRADAKTEEEIWGGNGEGEEGMVGWGLLKQTGGEVGSGDRGRIGEVRGMTIVAV